MPAHQTLKLYSSEVLDRSRDRKAHGLCPQAQPLRTSRFTMILVAYRHGLRASEVCDLQWQQIELSEGRLHVHRVKNGIPSVHPIRGDEMRALRKLRRDYPKDAYVLVSERGGPKSLPPPHPARRRGCQDAFPDPPPMLRHACGAQTLRYAAGDSRRTRLNTSRPCCCQSSARSSRKRLLNARRVASGGPPGFPVGSLGRVDTPGWRE